MADSKITALASIGTGTDPANDPLVIVDVSDVSPGGMSATGTTKKVTLNNLLACSPTATLASATITGNLTVQTNAFFVNSANNNVGIGTLTPSGASGRALEIYGGAGQSRLALKNDTTGSASTDGSQIALVGSQLVIQNREASEITFETNNSERYRLASDGVATWSNVGGVAGTAMTLNSTGLGVGRTPISKLTVDKASQTPGGTTPNGALVITDTVGSNLALEFGVNSAALPWIQSRNSTTNTYYDLLLNPNGGNVGIGVTPSLWNNNYNALDIGQNGTICGRLGTSNTVDIVSNGYRNSSGNWVYKLATSNTACRYQLDGSTGSHIWYSGATGTAGNTIAGFSAATMTLDASGRLLVGQTSTGLLNINGIDIEGGDSNGGSYIIVNHKLATASGQQYAFFGYNAVKTGDITQNGTTGVLYNTVSDYRLKESIQPLSNGLSRVSALKPSIYKWKSDGSSGEGFLAHELAEVVPFAVTGEKNAVNEDGSIKAQSVDMSRVIPILVAAIQELTARVQTLETR